MLHDVMLVRGGARLNLSHWLRVWKARREREERQDACDTLALLVASVGRETARDRAPDGAFDVLEQGRV